MKYVDLLLDLQRVTTSYKSYKDLQGFKEPQYVDLLLDLQRTKT